MSNIIKSRLKRSALTVALGMVVAGGVQAQSAVGSIFGQTSANTTITIQSVDTGVSRTLSSDASGNFNFSQLSPGRYRVTANGVTRDVLVRIGSGTHVQFASQDSGTLDTVQVVGQGGFNPIDVSSVESTSVFTAEQIDQLPVSSDVTNVALLAPGTVRGDTGFGNLASFGGSSVAENGYYINGFDVTNARNMLSFADLPFQAIGQQQVKVGGYGAEYGRSLGGVVSLVTKAGSNEWHWGASVEYAPEWARKRGKDVVSRDPAAADPLYQYRSDNYSDGLIYSAYASGPIVKDRLFFFAIYEGRDNESNSFGQLSSSRSVNKSPQGLAKLDWYITDSHLLEFTGIYNKGKSEASTFNYSQTTGAPRRYNVGQHEDPIDQYEVESGGEIGILKYTGYLTDNFTLSSQFGYLSNLISSRLPANPPNADCPWAYSFGTTVSVVERFIGCNPGTISTISDLNSAPDEDIRKGFRVDADWVLGDHKLRFGVDRESYLSHKRGQTYAGGINWAYYRVPQTSVATGAYAGQPGRTVNGELVPRGSLYARSRVYQTSSADYENINSAVYLEDSWQITDNFMTYVGLRGEKFESRNGDGIPWVESEFELAPRLGFSWDVMGDSTVKVFGNAGRYYIPVATNSSIRATGAEFTELNWYYVTGWSETDGRPTGQGQQIGATQINGSSEAPNPASVASTNLSPMYSDEFILGSQWQLNKQWMVGVRGVHRKVRSGMDDACTLQPFIDWAADQGLDDFDPGSVPHCYFINPGSDVSLNMDTDGDGDVEVATVPASYFGLPEYKRSYSALEFTWERAGEKLQLQGSYQFAKSRGNIEGYVNSTLEQGDPGLTQDFDHYLFMDGSYGYLPNDRTHTIKTYGIYKFNDEWQLGANLVASSGRPINCQGYVPLELAGDADVGTLTPYSGSSFYCLNDAGQRVLGQRGDQGRTPWIWQADVSASYIPAWAQGKLKFKVDVYNLFNNGKVTEYNEFKEAARDVISLDYMNDVNYQSPRSVRFMVRYDY